MELVGWNVVIAARQFNPSILSMPWLIRHGIAREEEFLPSSLFAEGICQAYTGRFVLLIVPDLLQLAPAPGVDNEGQVVADTVGNIVRALPETPYTGIGLNFTWHEIPEVGSVNELSRRLFFKPGIMPYADFDSPDARFGGYLSRDYGIMRLKLDIKPITLGGPTIDPPQHRLQFAFNFHKDLSIETAVDSVTRVLAMWDEVKAACRDMMQRTLRGGD